MIARGTTYFSVVMRYFSEVARCFFNVVFRESRCTIGKDHCTADRRVVDRRRPRYYAFSILSTNWSPRHEWTYVDAANGGNLDNPGGLAQLGERLAGSQKVTSSSLVSSIFS